MADYENRGYRRVFGGDGMSVGLFFPITASSDAVPSMDDQLERARLAADVGFDALWVRDVPLFWPTFGDAGQVYDPWVWLSHVAAGTEEIALATGSVVLPLRHPLHVAKAAASVDRLSDGRLVLGVASGDRMPEFAAFGVDADERGRRFRDSVALLRRAWAEEFPNVDSPFGTLDGSLDVLPKPTTETLPLLVTGHARQELAWIADRGDGWLFYQLPRDTLESYLADWRDATDEPKPFAQGLHVVLEDDPAAEMRHVHQGFAAGSEWFLEYFRDLQDLGVDHVAVNLRGNDRPVETVIQTFATEVLDRL
ncbi:MAG: LLM class oxidoreductase [Haloarculaceae archaeon]